jgi:hypothetical protein
MMPARQWPQRMVPSPTPKMPKASKLTSPQNVRELGLRLLCLLRHPSACLITPISILKHTATVIIFAISEVQWTKFLHLMAYLLGRAPLVWGTSFLRTGAVFLQVSPNLCLHLLPPWRQGQRGGQVQLRSGVADLCRRPRVKMWRRHREFNWKKVLHHSQLYGQVSSVSENHSEGEFTPC